MHMTAHQRHHFNMKAGFDQDAKGSRHGGISPLYDGISQNCRQALACGIPTRKPAGPDKDEFYDLWSNDAYPIQERWLSDDGWDDERSALFESLFVSMYHVKP